MDLHGLVVTGQIHHWDNLGYKCSAIWYMSIAPLTDPFPVPVEEEIAIFCEAGASLPNS